ncbi:MAG: cytochrome c, partial [Alteromonadaceae bacterium]|nr:cytochrome c [Alteromonadaceae bacterium]
KWLDQQHQLTAQAAAAEKASLNASMSMDELMALGKDTYLAHCAACHQSTGAGLPPAFPALKGNTFIKQGKVADHISTVFNGRSGTGMQAFGKQLSLKQLAAVVTYERNAWGNNTGDTVQAADVQAAVGGEKSATATSAKKPAVVPINKNKSEEKIVPIEDLTKIYTMAEMMKMGEQVYTTTCAACHQATGKGIPPAFPALDGSKITNGDVAKHLNIVIHGSSKNPAMVAFSSQLTKTQIAAVITYERNSWSNKTGDLIQVADVAAASAK